MNAAIVKVLLDDGQWCWVPVKYRWQAEAEKAGPPRCTTRRRCGLRLAAQTPEALTALILAHETRCSGCP